jgi:hypothetical protein
LRVLLDECIDVAFTEHVTGHSIKTVADMGWAGIKNGELLRRASSEFNAFVTIDQNLRFQQNLSAPALRIVIMRPQSSRLHDLLSLRRQLLGALQDESAGVVLIPS